VIYMANLDSAKYYDSVGETGFYPRELIRFEQTFPHILKEGTLLDIGCGEGDWLKYLSEKTNLKISGMDVSQVRLDIAKKRLQNEKIKLVVGDIKNLKYDDNSIDQITAMEVLEHIPSWQDGFKEMVRVASKRVVVTVPYEEKLSYQICPKCGTRANLYGHINSLGEKNFMTIGVEGKITFAKLLPAYLRRIKASLSGRSGESISRGERDAVVCPKCYTKIPFRKHFERGMQLMKKVLTGKPEYLLVQVDK